MNHDNQLTFTVTQLTQQAKYLLEKSFAHIQVEGEISNFSKPASGHWYFTLKDDASQVRCAMFRNANLRVDFKVEAGVQVLITARVSLYQARGDFQLIIESMQTAGAGKLMQQFEALKKKLQAKGWFDDQHKLDIPTAPKTIGIITSSTGAALRDILRVLNRRYCLANIIIYPCLVQGNQAAEQIAQQITKANQRAEVDVLLLARGGGSIEDLWAFNEEVVATAIFNSQLPLITGIGHQIDFTIADFVADLRAATPSAAAEVVSPDQKQLLERIKRLKAHLASNIWYLHEQQSQHHDYLQTRLLRSHPQNLLTQHHTQFQELTKRFCKCSTQLTELRQQKLTALARTLHAVSPLAVLGRGYAIVKNQQGKVISNAKHVASKERLEIQLQQGKIDCEVVNDN